MHYLISIKINVEVKDQAALLRAFAEHIVSDTQDALEFAYDTVGTLAEVDHALLCMIDPGRLVDDIPGVLGTGSEHFVDVDPLGALGAR